MGGVDPGTFRCPAWSRLAGWSRADAAAHRPRSLAAGNDAGDIHHSQPCVPGSLRRELVAAPWLRMGLDAYRCPGVLGTDQLPEIRVDVQQSDYNRKPP